MKFGVVVFPGSNCDRDMQDALQNDLKKQVIMLWHKEKDLSMFSTADCIVLPGGFSYGDYMRCGAIARFSPMMQSVIEFAQKGGKVLGVCNGFQILCESQLLPGVLLERHELCAMVGMTDDELTQLETFGIVSPRSGDPALYSDDAVAIAKPACEFLRFGVDARHLRNWRTSAEREASLYEQLVTPRYRQRNPEARAEALSQLRRLDVLGATLRAAMMRQALRHHFES
jgi:putative intracellular protease/amidase